MHAKSKKNGGRSVRPACNHRRGQALIEFAMVSLVLYLLLAAILTFGHALYVAQGLQTAADLTAREISRTALPVVDEGGDEFSFEDALSDDRIRRLIFDEALLVIDLNQFYATFPSDDPEGPSIFGDLVPTLPLLNQQLITMMIVDRPDNNTEILRYPGAMLERDPSTIAPPDGVETGDATPYQSANQYQSWVGTGFRVSIPLVERSDDGSESIRFVDVVEEIDDGDDATPDPFQLNHPQKGIVAQRLNFPFQSASMSSFQRDESDSEYPFEPTIGRPNEADEDVSTLTRTLPNGDVVYAGTYGGVNGLGAQGALGRIVRPYRRVISAQAIYRREVFSP